MKPKTKKVSIKGSHDYWAVLCDCTESSLEEDMMICGVYASKKEALEASEEVKDCVCKHYIKECSVVVTYQSTPLTTIEK